MKKFLSITLALALISLSGFAQISLTYDLTEGLEYDNSIVLDLTISQTVMGQTQDVEQGQGYGFLYTVKDVNSDGSYLINVAYTSVMVNQPMAGMVYDSEKDGEPTNPAAKAIASSVGTSFDMEMQPNGKILNVSGMEAMLDSMVANMDILDDAQAAQFKTQMSAQFNDESMVAQMKRSIIEFPDNELSKGDTWTNNESVSAPFPMNIQTTYELVDYDESTITLNASSDVYTEEGGELNMGGATMTPDLSGVQSGTITLDRKTGLVLSAENEQLISGTMYMTAPQELDIPMEIMGTTKVEGEVKN